MTTALMIGLAAAMLSTAVVPAAAAGRFALRANVVDQLVAQACLTPRQIRAAVRSGRAIRLTQLIAVIRNAVTGEVLPQPQLCRTGGGGLVYIINILNGNGQVQQLTIDAGNGDILGH